VRGFCITETRNDGKDIQNESGHGYGAVWQYVKHVVSDRRRVGSRDRSHLACGDSGRMPPFLPGLNWHTLSSETERHETKRRRRAVSEPTPMDVDGEEGSQFRCSFCNGNRFPFQSQGPESVIDAFDTKDIVSRSHPDTSPIYFYSRGKPFFECASTYNLMLASSYLCLFRFTNFSFHSVEYDGKIYATSEHRA
jgi:hypothetical protein